MGRAGQSPGARREWTRRPYRGTEPALVQPRGSPVEPQFLQRSRRNPDPAHVRRVQERPRRVLRRRHAGRRPGDPRAIRDHAARCELVALRAVVFGRRRENVGSELDRHGHENTRGAVANLRRQDMEAERQFDFLEGQWDAVCRVPTRDGWEEAPGTMTASRDLDGKVSVEHFEGIYHGGALKGLGLRAYNRETGEWEHTWTDTLQPGHFHVWKGAFTNGKIDLFGEWDED